MPRQVQLLFHLNTICLYANKIVFFTVTCVPSESSNCIISIYEKEIVAHLSLRVFDTDLNNANIRDHNNAGF